MRQSTGPERRVRVLRRPHLHRRRRRTAAVQRVAPWAALRTSSPGAYVGGERPENDTEPLGRERSWCTSGPTTMIRPPRRTRRCRSARGAWVGPHDPAEFNVRRKSDSPTVEPGVEKSLAVNGSLGASFGPSQGGQRTGHRAGRRSGNQLASAVAPATGHGTGGGNWIRLARPGSWRRPPGGRSWTQIHRY